MSKFKHKKMTSGAWKLFSPNGKEKSKSKATLHLTPEHIHSLNELHRLVAAPPVLGIADDSLPYILYCDASAKGIGVILSQIQPIRKKGLDATSFPTTMQVNIQETHSPLQDDGHRSRLIMEQKVDPLWTSRFPLADQPSEFKLVDGVLHILKHDHYRVCLPENMLTDAIHDHHDCRAHQGVEHTMMLINQTWFHPKAPSAIPEYISRCVPCQQVKVPRKKPEGAISTPREISPHAFHTISMDILLGLP